MPPRVSPTPVTPLPLCGGEKERKKERKEGTGEKYSPINSRFLEVPRRQTTVVIRTTTDVDHSAASVITPCSVHSTGSTWC